MGDKLRERDIYCSIINMFFSNHFYWSDSLPFFVAFNQHGKNTLLSRDRPFCLIRRVVVNESMGAGRYLLRNKGIGDKTTFVVFRDGTEAPFFGRQVVKFPAGG